MESERNIYISIQVYASTLQHDLWTFKYTRLVHLLIQIIYQHDMQTQDNLLIYFLIMIAFQITLSRSVTDCSLDLDLALD